MISWLLVAVLLFAGNAITTPTSTTDPAAAAPPLEPAVFKLDFPLKPGDNRDAGAGILPAAEPLDRPTASAQHLSLVSPPTVAGAGGSGGISVLGAAQPVTRPGASSAPVSSDSGTTRANDDGARARVGVSAESDHVVAAAADQSTKSSTSQMQPDSELETGATSATAGDDSANEKRQVDPRQQRQQQVLQSRSEAQSKQLSSSSAPESSNNNNKQQQQQQQHQKKKVYTNQFVIKVEGGEEEARRLAEKHGFIYLNHIVDNYYHLEHRRLAKRSLTQFDMRDLDTSIQDEPNVLKFERQVLKRRVKRDFIDLGAPPPPVFSNRDQTGRLDNNNNNNNNHHHHQRQQQQHQQQHRQPTQMLKPAARQGQFLRPPNQAPANRPASSHHQQQHLANLMHEQAGRVPSELLAQAAHHQQHHHLPPLLDQLEMNSSGPMPFFLQANFSTATGGAGQTSSGGANINKHRPPPPPIPMGAAGDSQQRASNQTFHYANETHLPRAAAPFNDPSWPLMWYLDGGARNGFDLNVQAAWRMGYTGRGIVITILDDGLEKDHPDLQANYDPLASFDINGDDADPMPRYDSSDSNRHGTRCAGEVAAVPNNNICSIGIAYNSKVGGVRMLDGEVTDAVEARSLGLNNQHIHIYSASWGPDDNGKTVDGPGELATRAFIEGITYGRGGRGSIFVFASGNGGREHDNCNCDGYTNSIWTLSISSASENGFVPWYIEACSSTLATTYSSGSFEERQIATTDIRHSCTNNHTGTSASAPIAAGICALVLEANPELTWRDMQHIVVRTAKPANLVAKDWRTNAMGRNVSHAFGYGLMDAAAMIVMAKQWRKMPEPYACQVVAPMMDKSIPSKGYIELKLRVECNTIRFIEHVQSVISLTALRRGDIHIYLTSPHGTRSTLLAQRPMDVAEQGFRKWPFMTVHSWGESPNGIWTLEVHNDGKPQNRAVLQNWTITLYGTSDDPNRHLDFNSNRQSNMHAIPPAQQQQQNSQPATTTTTSSTTTSTSTSTTTTTSTTSTTTTPAPRLVDQQNRQQQQQPQLAGNQQQQPPPPPSFSPMDFEQTPNRQQAGRKPLPPAPAPLAGPQVGPVASTSGPPPPISASSSSSNNNKKLLLAGSEGMRLGTTTTASTTTTSSGAPPAGSVVTTISSTTSTVATNSEVQYDNGDKSTSGSGSTNSAKANKADFEVVAPPTDVTTGAATRHHQQSQHNQEGHLSDPFLISARPQIQVIDGNKLDAAGSSSSSSQAGSGVAFGTDIGNSTRTPARQHHHHHRPNQDELDANQLDSKLTKDYRSSGGGGGGHHEVLPPSYEEEEIKQTAGKGEAPLSGKRGPEGATRHQQQRPPPGAQAKDGAGAAAAGSAPAPGTSFHLYACLVVAYLLAAHCRTSAVISSSPQFHQI